MHAEIIAIGTELTTGAKLDTNSQWLSVELAAQGISTLFHTTVADDLQANLRVVREAISRVDLVIISGGLGPTLDDLTREVLAEVGGVELVLDEASLEIVREMFARRNRPMPERNIVQAMFPRGSTIIPNPRGTAPGIWMTFPRPGQQPVYLAALPGVPSEMKPMFRDFVLSQLIALGCGGGHVIRSAKLQIFGLGESQCEEMLGDLTTRGRDPEVGITVHEATISLRIEAHGTTAQECELKITATRALAEERLGAYLFGTGDEELTDVVVRLLRMRGETISIFEDATGGQLTHSLLSAEGVSQVLPGSLTGPTEQLARHLNLPETTGFSELVQHWRTRTHSTYALGIGPLQPPAASPVAGQPSVPTIPLLLVTETGASASTLTTLADPTITRSRTAKTILNQLRLHLLEAPVRAG